MLFPIYDYYYESSMTLEEVFNHYVENFYFRKYGRDKFDKILKKLLDSNKVRSLFDESYKKRLALNNVDFGSMINEMMWFMFQSNETQAVAVLALAILWHTNVNSHLYLKTEKELRNDVLMIFKKFQIYGDMTQEEFDRMRQSQFDEDIDDYPELDEDVDDEDDEEEFEDYPELDEDVDDEDDEEEFEDYPELDEDVDDEDDEEEFEDYPELDEDVDDEDDEEELDDETDYDKNEAHIRSSIRKGLEEHMTKTMQKHGDLMNDPFTGGLMVEAAIGTYFQSIRKQNVLYVIASHFGIDLDSVLDDEINRAQSKYLK